jgi:hypothetical protein
MPSRAFAARHAVRLRGELPGLDLEGVLADGDFTRMHIEASAEK